MRPFSLALAMQVFLWLFLFALVVGGALLLIASWRARQRNAQLWGADEPDQLATWDAQGLGVSQVRVAERTDAASPREPVPAPEAATPEDSPPEAASRIVPLETPARSAASRADGQGPASGDADAAPSEPEGPEANAFVDPIPFSATDLLPSTPAPSSGDTSARPARPRPEWWDDGAPGVGALLRSLVEVTGGSAAILRPSAEGYTVLAAAGEASGVIHARATAREIAARDAQPLADLPGGTATVVLGGSEAGLLPGGDAGSVGETAVRALRAASGAPMLVIDVSREAPLTERAEGLIAPYARLAARVLGLPEEAGSISSASPDSAASEDEAPEGEAPEADVPEASGDPLGAAMERIGTEIAAAREQGRDLALAVVVPYDVEDLLEGGAEEIEAHAEALRQRLLAVSGTRAVLPMGDLVLGALCEVKGPGAEKWARDLTREGEPVRVGIAVYGPRHVSPTLLRQDAVSALHQTYTTDEACVIVE